MRCVAKASKLSKHGPYPQRVGHVGSEIKKNIITKENSRLTENYYSYHKEAINDQRMQYDIPDNQNPRYDLQYSFHAY